ncbi:FGGY-family carbohydrate kinase [Oceaniglobus indicus]|uniref:FGGY-family carbohydrate kinase n=1 Tax=Oceaniglobus indicus TaxID=2047749 RepID=UPI000C17F962|nr:FGGY family carbohydrate kinase [Oceaniglobus indicus]
MRRISVIDIGKTNVKLAMVGLDSGSELAVLTRPNTPLAAPPYRHFDTEGHWQFILDGLAVFQGRFGVDGIAVTTHGASGALLDAAGNLAVPILDYEDPGPDSVAAEYDRLRPDFADTGTPRLPGGLNLGAQIHWQFARDPGLAARTATVLTYPQYWAFRLTGVRSCDVTSLGCHSDLWLPGQGALSPLCAQLGIQHKIAPRRRPDDILGPVLPEIAARCGLSADTPVVCGIHDSNASLYPYLLARPAPFSVVSTGTWIVVMAVGAEQRAPAEDTQINTDAMGNPSPSVRFMGGRTYETLTQGMTGVPDAAAIRAVSDQRIMLLPDPNATGAFTARAPRWQGPAPAPGSGTCAVAVSYYLALLTANALDQIGARGPIVVEGSFARNADWLRMLATACGKPVSATESATGTSLGAALLFAPRGAGNAVAQTVPPDPALTRYVRDWRGAIGITP